MSCDKSEANIIKGFGGGFVSSKGTVKFELKIDNVTLNTEAIVVPDSVQDTALLLGHPVSEERNIAIFKDADTIKLFSKLPKVDGSLNRVNKIVL